MSGDAAPVGGSWQRISLWHHSCRKVSLASAGVCALLPPVIQEPQASASTCADMEALSQSSRISAAAARMTLLVRGACCWAESIDTAVTIGYLWHAAGIASMHATYGGAVSDLRWIPWLDAVLWPCAPDPLDPGTGEGQGVGSQRTRRSPSHLALGALLHPPGRHSGHSSGSASGSGSFTSSGRAIPSCSTLQISIQHLPAPSPFASFLGLQQICGSTGSEPPCRHTCLPTPAAPG